MPTKALHGLTRDDARRLSSILIAHLPLNSQEEKRLKDQIALLPPPLRRSKFLSLMVDKLGLLSESTSPTSPRACAFHTSLNRTLIAAMLRLFRAEVSSNLDSLAASQSKLSPTQRGMVQNLRTVNGLWLPKTTVERRYLLKTAGKWYYQRDRCEACMLGRIARDKEVLTQLRTVLLSRLNPRKIVPPPRLLRWVDEFIKCHTSASLEMFMKSGEDSVALKGVRNSIKGALNLGYNPNMSGLRLDLIDGSDSGGHAASWHGGAQRRDPIKKNDVDRHGGVISWPRGKIPPQRYDWSTNNDGESDYKLQIINAYANGNGNGDERSGENSCYCCSSKASESGTKRGAGAQVSKPSRL